MKIEVVPYQAEWKNMFQQLKHELELKLKGFNPVIEHIGSTSVEGLSAKPVIDIMAGIKEDLLEQTIERLCEGQYAYVSAFTKDMPERRFFIRMKDDTQYPRIITSPEQINENIQNHKTAHIHITVYRNVFWNRHIAFREYLKNHADVRKEYQQLKRDLSKKEWNHPFEFNEAKASFMKEHEKRALEWYHKIFDK